MHKPILEKKLKVESPKKEVPIEIKVEKETSKNRKK